MIGPEQVLHVARLAKLRLSAAEERGLADQLVEILAWVDQLRELDALGAGPTEAERPVPADRAVPTPPRPLRPDETRPSLPREEVLRLAPAADGETFRVPPVIDGGREA
jgi:aspartyl-tRNA(Asn)/glutamyl-tRNA(Gln) amidotransferase subunit C